MYQQGDDMSFAETVPGVQHIPVPVADVGYAIHNQQIGGSIYDNDLRQLHALCEAAQEDDEESWERVRHWFRSHTEGQAREAAMLLGEYETTPLHVACRNCPPYDVIESIITAAPNTTMMVDTFGWLPLHYACANGAYDHIILRLADAYPEGKIVSDMRGRTPLHFSLGNIDRQASANTVLLLSSTGASNVAEENGMLVRSSYRTNIDILSSCFFLTHEYSFFIFCLSIFHVLVSFCAMLVNDSRFIMLVRMGHLKMPCIC
jgi:hypothetical protein